MKKRIWLLLLTLCLGLTACGQGGTQEEEDFTAVGGENLQAEEAALTAVGRMPMISVSSITSAMIPASRDTSFLRFFIVFSLFSVGRHQ